MATNGAGTTNTGASLNRAGEAKELLDAIQDLIIPFIRAADEDAAAKPTGHGLPLPASQEGESRTALVEQHSPRKLEGILNLGITEQGGGKNGLVEFVGKLLGYSVNTWDQGFMDKLYASTNAVGLVSELLLATLNTNAHVYQVSPVLTLVEKYATTHLAQLFGYTTPHAGGISQPGGSASNSTALVIARNTLYPSTKESGNGSHHFTAFTSAHGHYSLEKAAQMFGLGSKNVIPVTVDPATGQMLPDDLDRLVRESKHRGETPFFVNATAGTTVLGSFDPFPAIAAVCKRHNLWLHIDGSWGGSVVFSAEHRATRLAGAHLADSIAVTPHKMLGVPLTCSFLLGRDLRQFWAAMRLDAGYLFHGTPADANVADIYDLAELTPQCGRRADSLKMFLALVYYGEQHFADLVARAYENAEYLRGVLERSADFEVLSPTPLPCLQVCFYWARGGVVGDDAERNGRVTAEVARGIVRRGFMVDYAPGERGLFFRVVVNGNTRRGTLEGLVRAIEEVAGELGY